MIVPRFHFLVANRDPGLWRGSLRPGAVRVALWALILSILTGPGLSWAQDAQVKALRSEYEKGKKLALNWAFNPAQQQAQETAKAILGASTVDLKTRSEEIKREVALLEKRLETLPVGPGNDAIAKQIEDEWERKTSYGMEAEYWRAWSNYYYGVALGQSPQAVVRITKAKTIFRELLGFEAGEQIRPGDADTLVFEGAAQLAVLMGIAQCELLLGKGRNATADIYFGLFQEDNLVKDRKLLARFRQEATYKKGETLIVARQLDVAAVLYRRLFAGEEVTAERALSLAVRMVEVAGRQAAVAGSTELWQVGLEELARQNRYSLCLQLVDKHNLNLEKVVGFFLHLVRGKHLFARAQRDAAGNQDTFEGAAESFQAALAAPGARRNLAAAIQCRYQLATCKFELKKYGEAAALFEQAARRLEKTAAGDALWMSIVSYIRLNENGNFAPAIIKLARELKSDFPTHPKVVGIDDLIERVQLSVLTLEARVRRLEKVPVGDKKYDVARHEICRLWQQQWSQVRERRELATSTGKQLTAAVDTYLKNSPGAGSEKHLQAVLMAIDVHLNEKSSDLPAAGRYLAQAEKLDQRLLNGKPSPGQVGLHYRALRLARASDDQEEIESQARWLIEHGRGSRYELVALQDAVRLLDEDEKITASGLAKGYQFCSRIVAIVGSSVAQMKQDANVRIANSRLAHYAFETGKIDEAADLLDKLLVVAPRERRYLQRAGRANFLESRFKRAQQVWQTVRLGVEKGTDPWYEAKYYELASLAQIDRPRAKKVYRQFRVLYTKLPAAWQKKFEVLNL